MEWKHKTIWYYEQALKKLFKWGYRYDQAIPLNNGRYHFIKGAKPYHNTHLLMVYKEEWFLKYGNKFLHAGQTGIGDSINKEDFEKAKDRGCTHIIRVDPEQRLYAIELNHFKTIAKQWKNKEGKDVMSISIHDFTSCQCQEVVEVKAPTHFEKILKLTRERFEIHEGNRPEIQYKINGDVSQ